MRCETAVRRECEIASRRLRHVRVVYQGGGRNTFTPARAKLIVDCAASFPSLQHFEIHGWRGDIYLHVDLCEPARGAVQQSPATYI